MRIKSIEIEANAEEYPITLFDKNHNKIYHENPNGYWSQREFDSNNNEIYFKNSDGDWYKREFDSNNNQVYFENSNGYWSQREFDSNNNQMYYEDSYGNIIDDRQVKEMTLSEISKELGYQVKIIKGK